MFNQLLRLAPQVGFVASVFIEFSQTFSARAMSMGADGEVLPGPKYPVWGCGKCGESGNWASRLKCRSCGGAAPVRVQQDARAAAAKTVRPQQGRSGSSGGDQSRLAKEVKELKQQLAVVGFLKSHGIDSALIAKAEEAKVQELESKPPSALAARHRVENATRKVEELEERLQQCEIQKQEILKGVAEATESLAEVNFRDADDPVGVGMADLDPTAVDDAEGKQALETLKRLQRAAKEAAGREAAEGGRGPGGGAAAGAAGADAGGAEGSGQARAPRPPTAADFEGSEFHAGLKRAMGGENPEAAVAEFLAAHTAKRQRV
ncbi:unnamed protein product [Prorocentrum cordatum]|uniref:RanBP2-type domain-containing protein n=1 Tax=Prorocentrum cordatum TaxID=2364126 RepID=A0ABN9VGK3_9DINO|nr:unnamed protein product [Polarella glacialis]